MTQAGWHEAWNPALAWERRAARPAALDLSRILDLLLLALGGPFAIVVGLAIAGLIRLQGDGPVLYRQPRLGRWGRAFTCYKFRTMTCDAEARLPGLLARDAALDAQWTDGCKLPHDPRITPLGRWLRHSSLDELPQLLNVLRGEMSLVGPRPIGVAERARYGRRFASYAKVRPGITGLWQVSGRSRLSYRRRVALDVLYTRRRSLALDCRILLATAPAVLSGRGAS